MWFEKLTGFSEESPDNVRKNFSIEGENILSKANGKIYAYGELTIPNLHELRKEVSSFSIPNGKLSCCEIIADVQDLHKDPLNEGALFQVASQFNLLEMVSPEVSPEHGIADYEYDKTQGPACAMAAGAGTLYRNYFTEVNGRIGQSSDNQIDTLLDLDESLGNADNSLWVMKNGYALASRSGLKLINERLTRKEAPELDALRQLLRIGVQHNTEVTISDCQHKVTQAYCSALPVAYSQCTPGLWEKFARLILEASYEATLCAAIINTVNSGNNRVFLTLLGGGAFGNETRWIIDAIRRALLLNKNRNLDIAIVSYGESNKAIATLVNELKD